SEGEQDENHNELAWQQKNTEREARRTQAEDSMAAIGTQRPLRGAGLHFHGRDQASSCGGVRPRAWTRGAVARRRAKRASHGRTPSRQSQPHKTSWSNWVRLMVSLSRRLGPGDDAETGRPFTDVVLSREL